MTEELPEDIITKLNDAQTRSGLPIDEIMTDFWAWVAGVKDDKQFKDDDARYRYALMRVYRNYIALPPVKPYTVVPIGAAGTRIEADGKKSRIFALIGDEAGRLPGIQQIVCRGINSELYRAFNPFAKYTVKLGRFGKDEGDFIADNRAKFEGPERLTLSHETMLEKLGIQTVTIASTTHSQDALSHTRSDGYVDRTDWKHIQASIIRHWSRTDDDDPDVGSGRYTIADDSIWDEGPTVTSDGRVLPPGFTVWVHPNQMIYDDDDICDFYGSISLNRKTGEPQMNAFLIIPVYRQGGTEQ